MGQCSFTGKNARPLQKKNPFLANPEFYSIAGVSRAVTITCAYLMSVTQFGWPEILEAVRCARPQAGPNFGFQNQLMKFYQNGVARSERERLKTLYPDSKFDDDAHLQKLLRERQATTDPID